MSIFLDVLTVAVFILVIYHSYKRGLVRAVITFVGTIAAFVIAYLLSNPLGAFLDHAFLNKVVHGSVNQLMKNGSSQFSFLLQFPDALGKTLSKLNPSFGDLGAKADASIVNAVAMPLATVLSKSIAFFVLLAVCLVLVGFIAHLSGAVTHMPIIGTLDALGGALIGILEAMVIMFFLSSLLSLLISFFALEKNPPLTNNMIKTTYVYKYIDHANPLTGMLLKK